jgi:group II intron reverse transcriptase/maturase/CRISPR-associated endonuclease Cas1
VASVVGNATARVVTSPARSSTISPFIFAVADDIRLLEAWHRVRSSGGSPGPDGVTIEQFQRAFGSQLARLRNDLLSGVYRPGPVSRVFIPKDDGSFRSIGLSGMIDRVAQTSAASWLQEHLDATFHEASYGYRPGLGPRRAALRAWKLSLSASHAVNADIEKFFDNVDHRILVGLLAGVGMDEAGANLIVSWLTAAPRDRGQLLHTVKGLPQGSPVSPILANLYLHDFDITIARAGYQHVRYADDFIVFSKSEAEVKDAFILVQRYLGRERGLSLKAAKTHMVAMTEGFRFVGFDFSGAGPALPASSTDRFRAEFGQRLDAPGRAFAEIVRSVNDAVRGWKSYYGGLAPLVDEALASLDTWRRERCATFLKERAYDAALVDILFERLGGLTSGELGPGFYGQVPDRAPAPPLATHLPADSLARAGGRTARSDIRARAIAQTVFPELSRSGDLHIPTFGAFVTLRGGAIVVTRKKQPVFEASLDDVRSISVLAPGAAVATHLLRACAGRRIDVVIADEAGRPVARLQRSVAWTVAETTRRVLMARRTRVGTRLVSGILRGKLRNQRALLLYHSKYAGRPADVREALVDAAARVNDLARSIDSWKDPLARIRRQVLLTEAHAAVRYWGAVAILLRNHVEFPGRRLRGATDPVNALLNYGYWRLHALVWSAAERAGLVAWAGLLHVGRRSTTGLVLDLMEEFRAPAVDRVVFGLIGRGFVAKQRPDGRLRSSTRLTFERALNRNLARRLGSATLADQIRHQMAAFRRAVDGRTPYQAFVMGW